MTQLNGQFQAKIATHLIILEKYLSTKSVIKFPARNVKHNLICMIQIQPNLRLHINQTPAIKFVRLSRAKLWFHSSLTSKTLWLACSEFRLIFFSRAACRSFSPRIRWLGKEKRKKKRKNQVLTRDCRTLWKTNSPRARNRFPLWHR